MGHFFGTLCSVAMESNLKMKVYAETLRHIAKTNQTWIQCLDIGDISFKNLPVMIT